MKEYALNRTVTSTDVDEEKGLALLRIPYFLQPFMFLLGAEALLE